MIKPSEQEIKILNLLNKWEEKEAIYSLDSIHWFSIFENFKEYERSDFLLSSKYLKKNKNPLLEFGAYTIGDGGVFCLWNYDGLEGVAPVVYHGDNGGISMVAPSFHDFVCMLLKRKIIYATGADISGERFDDWGSFEDDIDEQLEELACDRDLDEKELPELLEKSFAEFRIFMGQHLNCRTEEEILSDINKHPNFVKWLEEIENDGM